MGVLYPHRHVDEQQVAKTPFGNPLLGRLRQRREPVIKVNAVTNALFVSVPDHFLGLRDLV